VHEAASFHAPHLRGLIDRVGWLLTVAIGYYVLAVIGTVLSIAPSGFAVIWPATAFLTGVLLLTPPRHWWSCLIGVVPAHFHLVGVFQEPHFSLAVASSQVAGNLALAVASAIAVRRTDGGRARFDSFRGALTFILIAGMLVPAVVNAAILGLHMLTGWAKDFWLSWRQWMLASIFPTITITPLMLLTLRESAIEDGRRASAPEILLLSVALFALTFVVFGPGTESEFQPMLLLTPMPILLWAAARWGVAGTSLALLVFAGAVMVRALHGAGPFANSSALINMLSIQAFLTAASVSLILLAAGTEERHRAEEQLRRSEARMGVAAAATDTGLWQWELASGRLWMTEHCRSMFGLDREAGHAPAAFLEAVHADDQARVRAALLGALAGDDVRALAEFRVLRKGGEERWFTLHTRAETSARRRVVRVSGAFRDVSAQLVAQQQSEQLSRRLLTLQEDERKNIAEALHDSTTQHLVAVSLILGVLERRTAQGGETRGLIDDIRGSITEAINELRTFTYLLRPPDLERQGLCDTLRRYVRGFGMRTGLVARATLNSDADELAPEQQQAMLRIAQESLANVYRHAGAARVWVGLRRRAGEIHLVVKDDGHGMTGDGRPRGEVRLGVGIPGMIARVRQLGGKIDIRSKASGATVHVALPMMLEAGRNRSALVAAPAPGAPLRL
jgi:signal transduction histidine kinase